MRIFGSLKKNEHTHTAQTQTQTNKVVLATGAGNHGGEAQLSFIIKQEVARRMRQKPTEQTSTNGVSSVCPHSPEILPVHLRTG